VKQGALRSQCIRPFWQQLQDTQQQQQQQQQQHGVLLAALQVSALA
jgi:hypothetical protein